MGILGFETELGREPGMRILRRTPALALIAAAMLATGPAAQGQPNPPPAAAQPPVIYIMEQLRTGALPPELVQKLGPLNTLAEVETLLKANRIGFAWGVVEVASETMPPEWMKQLNALKPAEVFVIPAPNGTLIGVIVGRR